MSSPTAPLLRLRGHVSFDGPTAGIGDAAVYVRLLDVSRLDAESLVLGEHRIEQLPHDAVTDASIPFTLETAVPAGVAASLTLMVHVDVDRDGQVGAGDFISMENIPVLPDHLEEEYRVHVRQVAG